MTYADLKVIERVLKDEVEHLRDALFEAKLENNRKWFAEISKEIENINLVLQHLYSAKVGE